MKVRIKKEAVRHTLRSVYWFLIGFVLAGALLSSAVLFYFQYKYRDKVIPGVFVENTYIGGMTRQDIEKLFMSRNEQLGNSAIIFSGGGVEATVSAKTLGLGYNVNFISDQALTLGKTKNILSDTYILLSSYVNGTFLSSVYSFNDDQLKESVKQIQNSVYREPVDALFEVNNNRVVAFKQSSDGKSVDYDALGEKINKMIPSLVGHDTPEIVRVEVPVKTTPPKITTEEANNFGIVEAIGFGKSTFYHSIPGRVHNVVLATSRINGALVAPGEEFSFDKTLGDVSKFTGYEQAYVISGGKTVLGDGGGVCQVSTTLFRALLNAGLPITERHAHAYRVGYYEQDEPPGLDATTFVPTVDLKFKNDTGNYILIQGYADPNNYSLVFTLYGKSDGRKVSVTQPVISNVSAAPPDLYQDDPTLPIGVVKQVDFAAPGGKSVFSRTVTRNGQVIINDTFVSVYRPWQAVFLRGTKT